MPSVIKVRVYVHFHANYTAVPCISTHTFELTIEWCDQIRRPSQYTPALILTWMSSLLSGCACMLKRAASHPARTHVCMQLLRAGGGGRDRKGGSACVAAYIAALMTTGAIGALYMHEILYEGVCSV